MKRLFWLISLSLNLFLARPSQADPPPVGNDNPTGVTGEFSGSITTGGSYDPYTGNGKRVIDDLTVTGSIGEYPLKWTRTLNTRGGSGSFGDGGGWKHNYSWGLTVQQIPGQCGQTCICDGPHGVVSYPDGRVMNLRWDDSDQAYVQADGYEPMGDRVVHVAGGSGNYYDLRLKDGGRVEFRPASGIPAGAATAIVDPYGRRTTLQYSGGQASKLWRVTEPGGRFLQISYEDHPWQNQVNPPQVVHSIVISQVEARDGLGHVMEKVVYSYYEDYAQGPFFASMFLNLTQVAYDDGSHALYQYNPAALATPNNPWSFCAGTVRTCNDVRFAGPMSKIEYEYAPPGGGQAGIFVRGQVKAEHRLGGPAVSTVDYQGGLFDRKEIRPDGATRQLSYRGDGLDKYTDFAYSQSPYHTTTITFTYSAPGNPDHYLRNVTDARNYTTSTEKEKNIGAVIAVIHPNQSRVKYAYTDLNNPHYLASKEDERGKITYYDRDSANRTSQIRYPDGGVETFDYEGNPFGLVQKHGLTSGGVEEFRYDNRGLKELSWPPATESDPNPSAHPTFYWYYKVGVNITGPLEGRYDLIDRLQCVKDPLGNHTWYEYNKRGQVTKVTHHDGTFTQSFYNDDGTLQWTEDEFQHRTTYTYDEYKRVTKVTNPLGKETTNSYTPWNGQGAFSHTTSSVYLTTMHSQKKVRRDYDSNFRLIETILGYDTADAAKTSNTYDEVGNLKTVKDPKGQISGLVTAYEYDHRNRRTKVIDALGHPTTWEYDDAGNMKKETRADNKFRTWDLYDAMNRVKHTTGFLGAIEQTSYDYDAAGNLTGVTDANQRVYQTGYDQLSRKKSAAYPPDPTNSQSQGEAWRYDIAGNLLWYKNTASQYKHLEYDTRNRQRLSYWNNSENPDPTPTWSVGPKIAITPDAANRILEIRTNNGETIVAYGYDNANHKIWEDQTVAGFTRRVATDPDDDGNRGTLSVSNIPGAYSFSYGYTQRQQLKQVNRGGSSYVEFSYDVNGNLIRRQNMAQGQARDATKLQYDELNRITICEQTGYDDVPFARGNYNDYDLVNNLMSISRHEDGDKGEIFTYDDANQLSSVSYKADVAPHAPGGAPGGMIDEVEQDGEKETLAALAADPEREPLAKDSVELESVSGPHTVTYDNDAINRRSMSDTNVGIPTNYDRNHLNQYTSVTGHGALNYDGNLNVSGYDGWTFVHDAEKRLLSVAGNGHSAQFAHDGLGRCVKRTIDGLTTVFTYDGWKPVAEWTGAGTFVAWNLYGAGADEILVRYQQNPTGYLHYHLDAMGNVQFLLSDRPDPGLEKYTYDVFGKPTITGWNGDVRPISNHGNRFLFRGREYLYTFGLYDYRRRIYHPGLGRFIQTDPLGLQIEAAKLSAEQRALYFGGTAPEKFNSSEFNLYRYCHNDPVNQSDPFGLDTTVVWVDEGNRNQHETVVVKNKTEYTALTEPGLYVTVSGADANGDVVATVHHVINVRYSDDVGPKNKELQKKEPDHARELDKWRDERGKPATDILARHDGPLQGKTPEQVKEMVDHRLRDSFNNAVKETKKHDVPGDHILKGANRHD